MVRMRTASTRECEYRALFDAHLLRQLGTPGERRVLQGVRLGSKEQDRETFRAYRDALVEEVRSARMHYDLYRNLRAEIPRYKDEINRSPHFWSLTLNSHVEAFRISLCRAYDQHEEVVSLNCWLVFFRDRVQTPDHMALAIRERFYCEPLTPGELDGDLAAVRTSDLLVKNLVAQRGCAIAHVGSEVTRRHIVAFERFPLVYGDLEELLTRAERIVARYSVLVTDENIGFQTHQREDYTRVLEDIRVGASRSGSS
jgi:HEPN superfamily AbiU2-like protein